MENTGIFTSPVPPLMPRSLKINLSCLDSVWSDVSRELRRTSTLPAWGLEPSCQHYSSGLGSGQGTYVDSLGTGPKGKPSHILIVSHFALEVGGFS